MSRRVRNEYVGGIYHIIQRGNNREYIFAADGDKRYLLSLLREYVVKLNFEMFGYVIMDNHYHLILRRADVSLGDIMHRVNHTYSRVYNIRNHRTGHLFENCYQSIVVADETYLLSLLRYVHLNPVKAGICTKGSDYLWSSDRIYRANQADSGLVNINFVLDQISSDRQMALKLYQQYMDVRTDDDPAEEHGTFEAAAMIGVPSDDSEDHSAYKSRSERKALDDILWEVTQGQEVFDLIKCGSTKHYLTAYKKKYIEAGQRSGYTMKEIGECISLGKSAIYRILSLGQKLES